jgi:hypothetical protein
LKNFELRMRSKKTKEKGMMKIGEKGGLSVYGLGASSYALQGAVD